MIAHKKPWCMIPAEPIISLLPKLKWQTEDEAPASTNSAALMLYVALNFAAEREEDDEGGYLGRAVLSYPELNYVTGLSRKLIAHGLRRLEELKLVLPTGSDQKRGYVIPWGAKTWFKLPCRAILHKGAIAPFGRFHMRSKSELHALKLYLYLAAVRSNQAWFSMSSHQKIHEKTGIPENGIRRAHSLLTSVGLLAGIDREHNALEKQNEPNKYYLSGYQALWRPIPEAATQAG
jgi:hypothetical protein